MEPGKRTDSTAPRKKRAMMSSAGVLTAAISPAMTPHMAKPRQMYMAGKEIFSTSRLLGTCVSTRLASVQLSLRRAFRATLTVADE